MPITASKMSRNPVRHPKVANNRLDALRGDLLFHLARYRARQQASGTSGNNPASFDPDAYMDWRESELKAQFLTYFDPSDIAGADVLDLGCGIGVLSFLLCEMGPKSVTGIEVDPGLVEDAKRVAKTKSGPLKPTFKLGTDTTRIEMPDNSADVILVFDVMEHVMSYESIVEEWGRVLRPGGRVLIWWVPWFHPYGPHVESLLPVPWAHVFFGERAMLDACARTYDSPDFKPRFWDLDKDGNKKPNKWLGFDALPEVNKLTMFEFERLCKRRGLKIDHRHLTGFKAARFSHALTRLPLVRELFTANVTYKLRLPA